MVSDDTDFAAEAVPYPRGTGPLHALLQRPAEMFLAERQRWPLWLPVLMGAGIGVYFSLETEPPEWLGAVLVALAVHWFSPRQPGYIDRSSLLSAAPLFCGSRSGLLRRRWLVAIVSRPYALARRRSPVDGRGLLTAVDPLSKVRALASLPVRSTGWAPGRRPCASGCGCPRATTRRSSALAGASNPCLLPPPPDMPGAYDFERRAWFDRLGAGGVCAGARRIWIDPPDRPNVSSLGRPVAIGALGVTHSHPARRPSSTYRRHRRRADRWRYACHSCRRMPTSFRFAGLAHILVTADCVWVWLLGIAFFAISRPLLCWSLQ